MLSFESKALEYYGEIVIDKSLIQEVIAGHVNQAGAPGNSARHISLGVELPVEAFAFTVHQQCCSSMRASELLSQEIMLGKVDIGAVVGVESMSNAPYLLFGARNSYLRKHELVILIKPTIIRNESSWREDLSETQNRIRQLDPRRPAP